MTVFILFFILQSPTGADKFYSRVYRDLGECEFQRQWIQSKGFIVGDKCAVMNYRVTQ